MRSRTVVGTIVAAALVLAPARARAHCDSVDGPVVKDARAALESRNADLVLRWVAPDQEDGIRSAFAQALAVRSLGPEARDLADRYFFETLVRVHREGEGAPYTGLRPAGSAVAPGIAAADAAVLAGSADAVAKSVASAAERGIRERFARVAETMKHADHDVASGRAFVAAYVEFMHYTERLHADASGPAAHEGEPAAHRH